MRHFCPLCNKETEAQLLWCDKFKKGKILFILRKFVCKICNNKNTVAEEKSPKDAA